MISPPTRPSIQERLSGESPINQIGDQIDPGDAFPISPAKLVPTMLTQRELNYLHYLALETAGRGRIIELGSFLGGSTRALLEGQLSNRSEPSKIIVYDQFIAPDQSVFDRNSQLAAFGLSPNEDFLPKFQSLHRDYLDRLTLRQRIIPESISQAQLIRLYPEQEPIELLFVDAAKKWGVHHSIARTFSPHLKPGSTLIHQDFGDFRTPWIVIHQFQMRAYFEPMDWIRDTPTVSFRCLKKLADTSMLASTPQDFDPSINSASWSSLIEYWSQVLGFDAEDLLSGHHATHALHAGDPSSAIHYAEQYDRYLSTAASSAHYTSPDWSDWVEQLPGYLKSHKTSHQLMDRARALQSLHRAYRKMPTSITVANDWKTDAIKSHRWAQIEDRLVANKIQSVILIGGGRHTRWLLDSGWPRSNIRLRCIIDDNPCTRAIGSVPIISPEQFHPDVSTNCVVLPSSDAYEDHLIERIQQIPSLQSLPVWRVYTDTTTPQNTHDEIARLQAPGSSVVTAIGHINPAEIDHAPRHRLALGLDQSRTWIDDMCSCVGWPSWAQGHINARDAAFLWDLIEAVDRQSQHDFTVVEIGTASGVSTATLALGLDNLAAPNNNIHAFDILEYCFFDPTRRVGDAIRDLAPHLSHHIKLHTHCTARDAASCFQPQQVRLALIDADHRHPAPALDVLALLPVLAPGAWITLHDIELDRIQSNDPADPGSQSGPNQLYENWPFEKIREQRDAPRESNIGAIRVPNDPFTARRFLLELINKPISQTTMRS